MTAYAYADIVGRAFFLELAAVVLVVVLSLGSIALMMWGGRR